jgi:hypothetical protein
MRRPLRKKPLIIRVVRITIFTKIVAPPDIALV